jgi:hypothetical protein
MISFDHIATDEVPLPLSESYAPDMFLDTSPLCLFNSVDDAGPEDFLFPEYNLFESDNSDAFLDDWSSFLWL